MEKVNYTEAQVTELVAAYTAGTSIEDLAARFSKSTKSIVAKLSREGVYKSKAKASAKTRVTKADLVRKLEVEVGAVEGQLETLEKASHEALEFLVSKLVFENAAD